jgi:uncharacterized repeat protein (TIGR01451 family)
VSRSPTRRSHALTPWRVLLIAFVTVLAVGLPAPATSLSPSNDPLSGSTFQGGDGDHDDAAPLIDWQGLQAAGHVLHSADPNAADSAFAGGSKENQPGEWGFTTESNGVNPAKANLLDAWSSVEQRGGDTFLQLAFTREAADGTTYVAFELNRDRRLWDNGRAMVPCRRTGDVLVAFRAEGNRLEVVLQRWVTQQTDPRTGCARSGSLTDWTSVPARYAQGAVNAAGIANHLPGFVPVPGTVATGRFGEASLNLARLLAIAFGDDCLAFASIWMHSRSSTSESANMQDYVAPRPLTVRTCAASGTKFFDSDADGRRDPGELGIPRFLIWADYDDDGVRDRAEPFSLTDSRGRYVIHDIRPPDGTYRLRETLLTRRAATSPVSTEWVCSSPNSSTPGGTDDAPGGRFGCAWGPIDVTSTPNATGRDFGNWFPAQLTVEKQIAPADDPGRFDLLVDGNVVLPAAGDEAGVRLALPPGSYEVSERPAADTDPAAYRAMVECRRDVSRRGEQRSGVSLTVPLSAGQRASCTFRNLRPAQPAIAIRKTGPAIATAGETLRYTLFVTNPGEVAFPAAGVEVSDPLCDGAPALVSRQDESGSDPSPATLDPGETWVYRCSHDTPLAGPDCEPTRVDNSAVTATVAGATVDDEDPISTVLLCPDQPDPIKPVDPPGPTPAPDLEQPGPVAPTGPRTPRAGDAAVAGLRFHGAIRGCIRSRVPRVDFSGTRIARVRVYVNGQLRRRLTVQTLQRRVTPRVTLPPGRYRVTVRVSFERGSGTPPVTLSGTVRICRPLASVPVTG